MVTEKYKNVLENTNFTVCPEHWGGFIFKPFYFEFWEGHSNRLNHRVAYELSGDKWDSVLFRTIEINYCLITYI